MAKYKVTVNQGSRLPLYGGYAGGMELGQAQAQLLSCGTRCTTWSAASA